MTRIGWVLIALLCVLLGVGWYFLFFAPTSEEIDTVRAETENVRTLAAAERARAEQLREVRRQAPEAESALNAGQLLIPEDPSIPALFRQLQQAADESGARLLSINPSEPQVVTLDDAEVSSITVTMSLEGSYFQIVDLARRIEDPSIVPRAWRWDAASVTPLDYPALNIALAGEVYSRSVSDLPTIEEPPDEEPLDDDEDLEGDTDEADLDEVTP